MSIDEKAFRILCAKRGGNYFSPSDGIIKYYDIIEEYEAAKASGQPVEKPRMEPCHTCRGTGTVIGGYGHTLPCDRCNGEGYKSSKQEVAQPDELPEEWKHASPIHPCRKAFDEMNGKIQGQYSSIDSFGAGWKAAMAIKRESVADNFDGALRQYEYLMAVKDSTNLDEVQARVRALDKHAGEDIRKALRPVAVELGKKYRRVRDLLVLINSSLGRKFQTSDYLPDRFDDKDTPPARNLITEACAEFMEHQRTMQDWSQKALYEIEGGK